MTEEMKKKCDEFYMRDIDKVRGFDGSSAWIYEAGFNARDEMAEAEIAELKKTQAKLVRALDVASDQLLGCSLAIGKHGRNINTEFFIEYYRECSVNAKQALASLNLGEEKE